MSEQTTQITWASFPSQKGTIHLAATSKGLLYVSYPDEPVQAMFDWIAAHMSNRVYVLLNDPASLSPYIKQVKDYLEGKLTEFDLPVDLRGTPFQVAVWQSLMKIPYGQTQTYSQVAASLQKANASRAVGAAIGKNPLPFVVPCHRVVGKNGALTGYAGGLELKRELLRAEGANRS